MISLSHALPTDEPLSRRHLQLPSDIPTTSTDQLPLDVPRAWPFGLPEQHTDGSGDHPMQSVWAPSASHIPSSKMAAVGSHKREPSLSSTGSAGPASPYNQNTSNPQIVTADFGSDGFDQLAVDPSSSNQNYQIASLGKFPGYQTIDTNLPDMAYPMTIPAGPSNNSDYNTSNNVKLENSGVPNLDMSSTGSRQQASSVASSSVADDLPATPAQNETETKEVNDRRKAYGTAPKLDRTITDIFADELYNPNFQITSTSPPEQSLEVSPVNDIFSQRLNAANSQHLSAAQSPVVSNTSRTGSPFRSNSPLAASHQNDFASAPRTGLPTGPGQFNRSQAQDTVQHTSEQQQQQQPQQTPQLPSQTISPKDATIEFNEQEVDQNLPLFPPGDNTSLNFNKAMGMPPQTMNTMPAANAQFNFAMQPQMPHHLTAPPQFNSYANFNGPSPPRLSSASSSTGSSAHTPLVRARPMGTAADGGTYTCTYHGCTLRFETPALLQKHKREGHRQVQSIGAPVPRLHDTSMNAGIIGSQAGPHRCSRINPSTGKPCNTVFSRPYDLTRHEDTIHNARKQKVSCELCTEEKTFSRADALTRHFRVCHPDVEVPGKRRRG